MISKNNVSPEPREEAQILTLEEFGAFEDVETKSASPVEEADIAAQNSPQYASRQRLYLMVLADFGLAFTWLCKFAVAT